MSTMNIKTKVSVVAVFVLALFLTLIPVDVASGASLASFTRVRVSGTDRYGTAFAVADALAERQNAFGAIVVASGDSYPDALSGSYLAYKYDAPILLVNKSTEAEVLHYIRSHIRSNGTVYILGGTAVVRQSFQKSLEDADIKTERVAGKDRYGTNLAILQKAGTSVKRVLVCTGRNFADAISASAVGEPIMLVGGGITSAQIDQIRAMRPSEICIIGGKAAVSTAIEGTLSSIAKTVRIAGANRYDTSLNIANTFFKSKQEVVTVASGDAFPDALCGAPLALAMEAPLLLVSDKDKSNAANTYVQQHESSVTYVFGGTKVISNALVQKFMSRMVESTPITKVGSAQDMIKVMRSWLGYNTTNGKHKIIIDIYNGVLPLPVGYKMKYNDAWCDATISAAAIKANCVSLIGRECGVGRHIDIFRQKGIWIEDGTIRPKPGYIIVYNWYQNGQPNNGPGCHIGLVESVTNNTVCVLEGNYGDALKRRYIPIGWGYIRGYAAPRYASSAVASGASTVIDLVASIVN